MENSKVTLIKNIYFYLVSFVALMMMAFSLANVISSVLRLYVFTKADNYNYAMMIQPGCDPTVQAGKDVVRLTPEQCTKLDENNKQQQEDQRLSNLQRSIVESLSIFIIGLPLFILHWRIVRKKED